MPKNSIVDAKYHDPYAYVEKEAEATGDPELLVGKAVWLMSLHYASDNILLQPFDDALLLEAYDTDFTTNIAEFIKEHRRNATVYRDLTGQGIFELILTTARVLRIGYRKSRNKNVIEHYKELSDG